MSVDSKEMRQFNSIRQHKVNIASTQRHIHHRVPRHEGENIRSSIRGNRRWHLTERETANFTKVHHFNTRVKGEAVWIAIIRKGE